MKNKILIAKLGLDGHDRGAMIVYKILKEQGFDTLYMGIRHTPDEIVETAKREKIDIIGLSCLSGNHLKLLGDVMDLLKKNNLNVRVIVGGIIPSNDIKLLKGMGIADVFTPGTSIKKIIDKIKSY